MPGTDARRENIAYYRNAAAAEAAGFRPCLRCRPELSPGDGAWRRGDAAVARALKLIDEGLLTTSRSPRWPNAWHLGERQLRRLFVERLGAAPIGVHGTRRLLFAKQLLTETTLPITQVALAAGFGSLRRFNTTFQAAYRMAPREPAQAPAGRTRRSADAAPGLSAAVRLRGDAGFPARARVARRGSRRRDELRARDRFTNAGRSKPRAGCACRHGPAASMR